jgi:hypothetical protein
MHARDLMQSSERDQKTRARKYYTFPELEDSIFRNFEFHLTVDKYTTRTGEKYAVCISFYELYQDRIYDLLEDQQSLIQKRRHLLLKRDVSTGRRFVSGLRKIYVDTAEVPPSHKPFLLTTGSILGPEQGNFRKTKQ